MVLDEAQNTTTDQMLMFLTRLGQGSRAVITGDITQQDLPKGTTSGLVEAARVLRKIPGIGIVYLTKRDVVRNALVQQIVDAYETDGAPEGDGGVRDLGQSERRGSLKMSLLAKKPRPGAQTLRSRDRRRKERAGSRGRHGCSWGCRAWCSWCC